MDYFVMTQDQRLYSAAKLLPGPLNLPALTRAQLSAINSTMTLYVKADQNNQYPDYLEKPVGLVSEKLRGVMSKYQPDIRFKTVVLIEKERRRQELYYLIIPPIIKGLWLSEPKPGHELALDVEQAGEAGIFWDDSFAKRLIVRLDVAESILRRNSYGVTFEKVSTGTKGGQPK